NGENIAYLIRYHPPQLFPAGEQYAYSNTGYMLLASVAEKVAGEDFITLCRKLIFNPVKMKKTDIRTRGEKKSMRNFALGYIFVKERGRYVAADSFPEFNYTIWLGDRKGPGRISSTSHDMLLWDQALYHDSLIHPATLKAAFSPMRLKDGSFSSYGFGWDLSEDERVGKIVSHTGDNPGYKTEIVRLIDVNKTIILLNNNAHEKKSEIMALIKNWVMNTGAEDLGDN
ncbi:MAG TPA: serine hydrolase domain-containing protein, partial [Chryseolinea sp.]|nr:serine hydrolase domain-containing protein [Chryseolinea sp.]